jgi:sulfur-carrier protein
MNKVLFFAHLRDAVGEESITLNASGKTVADIKIELSTIYNLPTLDTVMTAINEEFAADNEVIRAGDVIAFIPPVSGG